MDARIPPQNLEAEQCALGSMLLEAEALNIGLELLSAKDFYRPAHRIMFNALHRLWSKGREVDQITLNEELKAMKKLEDIGGTEYIFSVAEAVPTAANIKYYADIVAEKSERRRVIKCCQMSMDAAFNEDIECPADNLVMNALKVYRQQTGEITTLSDPLFKARQRFEEMESNKSVLGVSWGMRALDNISYGIEDGQNLTLIGGRPSAGKTVLLLMAVLEFLKITKRVVVFSQETSAEKLAFRLLRNVAQVDDKAFRINEDGYREEAWHRINTACENLYSIESLMLINDIPTSITQLMSKTKRLVMQYKNSDAPVSAIFVDYLQIIKVPSGENRNADVGAICQGLKDLTGELKIPVIAATQVKRTDKKAPTLEDLREGGNQEAQADNVILIDNPMSDNPAPTRPAVLMIAKHKDGPTGNINCIYNGAHLRFEEN